MATAKQKKILELGQVEFEDGVKDTDRIVISEHDTGVWEKGPRAGPQGMFYLYDKDGYLLDIQFGKLVDKSLSQKRPKRYNGAVQGPANTKGRPKKIVKEVKVVKKKTKPATKPAKTVRRKAKPVKKTKTKRQKKSAKQKRQYKMSDETRALRAEAMRARMKAYWAKKKAEK